MVPTERMLRRTRRRIEAWGTLGRAVRKALGLLRLLRRRGQAGPSLSSCSCHYAAEQSALTVADRRRRLRGAAMLRAADVRGVRGSPGGVNLSLQTRELLLVPGTQD